MSFRLFDAPYPEPSAATGFAGNRIWRQSESRSDDCVARAIAEPAARFLLFLDGRLCMKMQDGGFDPWFSPGEIPAFQADVQNAVFLGHDESGPVLAASAGIETGLLPDTIKAIDLRSINAQGLLEATPLGAVAQGSSLLSWNRSHRFCSRCGAPSEMRAGGYKRVCTNCNAEHFPRTDPVVIMLTVTQDRCLMGRGAHFAPGVFSTLAGFLEPGETIEDAVRRETLEESGIRVGRVAYHASQPWPFPYSLMIGCFGEALNEDIKPDFTELEACRWFTRDEVRAAMERRHPDGILIPPAGAIAHHLIRYWVEQE